MSDSDRSRVIHLADALARIPGPAGEHSVSVLQRGSLNLLCSSLPEPSIASRTLPRTSPFGLSSTGRQVERFNPISGGQVRLTHRELIKE